MNEYYITNDPYNWFNRIEEFEKSLNFICDNNGDINNILEEVKVFFKDKNYKLVEENITKKESYLMYHSENDETLVFEILPEFNLNSINLRIYNEKFYSLANLDLKDENTIIFSRIVN